jgi:filamentous hemagglutinin
MKARGSSSSLPLFIAVAVLLVIGALAYAVLSAQEPAGNNRSSIATTVVDDAAPESISAAIDGALDEPVAAASDTPAAADDFSLLPAATATDGNANDAPTAVPTVTRNARATRTPRPTRTPRATATALAARVAESLIMRDQRIYALDGSLAYRGDVDLQPVLDRIEAGERDRHPNDGSVFANREGRLPRKPRGYYTEWVIRTSGLREVGPQRLITGQQGEVYYTPDHYDSFVRVR